MSFIYIYIVIHVSSSSPSSQCIYVYIYILYIYNRYNPHIYVQNIFIHMVINICMYIYICVNDTYMYICKLYIYIYNTHRGILMLWAATPNLPAMCSASEVLLCIKTETQRAAAVHGLVRGCSKRRQAAQYCDKTELPDKIQQVLPSGKLT